MINRHYKGKVMPAHAKNIAYKVYNEMWNNRHFQLCDTLLDQDFILHLPKKTIRSREQYKKISEEWLKNYPEIHYTIEDMVSEKNKVAIRWEGRDKSKNFSYKGQTFLLITNSKVTEAWEIF